MSLFARALLLTTSLSMLLSVPSFGAETLILEEITLRGQNESPQEESLTIREVRESSARDMGEALESVAGITSVNKGAIANDVVLRGLQRDNVNVFLDGVRLYGGCPSRMDPPSFHFDFAEVDSIEIIKGPYDVRNAGSLGGMINAVSKVPEPGVNGQVTGTYGSYNMANVSATGSYAAEDSYVLVGYAYKSSDVPESGAGKLITDVYPATSTNRYKPESLDSKAYEIATFWIKGGVKAGVSDLSLNYSYQNAEDVLYPYLLMDAEYDRTHRVNFSSTTELNNSVVDEINFQIWWNTVDHLMNDKLRVSSTPSMMVTRDVMMETDSSTEVLGAKLGTSSAVGEGALDVGIDYYLRNWEASNVLAGFMYQPQPMLPDVDATNVGVYSEYMVPMSEQLIFTGGLRVDFTDVEANDLSAARVLALYQPYSSSSFSNSTDFTEASGNLQLSWFPTDGIEVFTGLASGVRTPDAQELYIGLDRPSTKPTWIGNPNLDTTRNNQLDLGVKFSDDRYYLNTSVFYSSLDSFISVASVADPDGAGPLAAAKTYQNVDAEMYGAELAGQYALPADLYLRTTLSYVRGENTDSNTPLAEIPPLSGNLSLRYDVGSFFVETTERFAQRQDRVDPNLDEEETAGYGVTDIKAGTQWEQWMLTGGVNNVFDSLYYSHLSYQRDPFSSGVKIPETGLLAYLTLAYKF